MPEPTPPSGGVPADPLDGGPLLDRVGGDGPDPEWQQRLALLTGSVPAPPGRAVLVAVAGVVALVLAAVALRGGAPPPPEVHLPMATTVAPASTATTAPDLVVHVAGAVVRPGVHRLPAGARVADLLEVAGGPAPDADLDRLNLAAPLADGTRVFVPRVGEPVPSVHGGDIGSGGGASGLGQLVDINTADAALLETLPGIGPATAAAILDERARRGRFTRVEDLLDVRGIGEAKLAAIRDRVVVS
ncbi:MAG TPA: ComEA family DNA-binding protein [Acidimicrobiales bacterium]|nr:ComEA family DNA-binding protein [Acidimicrobiales bacterium]